MKPSEAAIHQTLSLHWNCGMRLTDLVIILRAQSTPCCRQMPPTTKVDWAGCVLLHKTRNLIYRNSKKHQFLTDELTNNLKSRDANASKKRGKDNETPKGPKFRS